MMSFAKRFEKERNGYFTSWSLKYPFGQCVETIGPYRVAVWANDANLAPAVMSGLKTAFAASNRDLRDIMSDAVEQFEYNAMPVACIILGKA